MHLDKTTEFTEAFLALPGIVWIKRHPALVKGDRGDFKINAYSIKGPLIVIVN
jgi:hypothetical protein